MWTDIHNHVLPEIKKAQYVPPNQQNGSSQLRISAKKLAKKEEITPVVSQAEAKEAEYKPVYVYKNVLAFIFLHYTAFHGLWLVLSGQAKWQTLIFTILTGWVSVESTMVGVHRFFTHKSFKGTFAFRLLVVIVNTLAGQNSIYVWARDHRLHHKFSETDADPHNAKRGFWFSHMTWLIQRKHPMVKLKGKTIDMSDLEADRLIMFQKKYFYPMWAVIGLAFPVATPVYFWGESWKVSFLVSMMRYLITLHGTWTVNSFAHLHGTKPYTRDIGPVESKFVAFISSGEGWHNYHHTFPWDYRAGEFGKKWNFSATIVEWFAYLGMAYDLKYATPEMVKHRIMKRGDGTHPLVASVEPAETVKPQDDPNLEINELEDLFGEKAKAGFSHVSPQTTILAH